jgi:asparagine synthase (glutamine-hydrolysing)
VHRYVAFLSDPRSARNSHVLQSARNELASRRADWSIACEAPGMYVLHSGARRESAMQAYPLANRAGVVLGRLFERHRTDYGSAPPVVLDASTSGLVLASGGRHLIERYWGSYVAILRDGATGEHHVFRDPTGNRPCYHARHEDIDVFFSHVEDCMRFFRLPLAVDCDYLTRWLVHGRLVSRSSGLQGIEDLPAGERLTVSARTTSRTQLWNPAQIADGARLEHVDEAASRLRSVVQSTVDAWASCYRHITLKLSGGLDSSIMAGCLAQAPSRPRVSYLNMSIDAALQREDLHLPGMDAATAAKLRAVASHGDERHFARLVAQRWNVPLIERQRTVSLDLRRLWHTSPTVRPAAYFTMMESDDAELELLRTHDTEAFFSGQGGDSVLLATMQPLPAIDYAYLHGLSSGLWHHILATAKLSRESVWTVMRKVLAHGLLRRPYLPAASVLQRPTLVCDELLRSVTDADFATHLAQLTSYARLPPGKQNHVSGVAAPMFYDFVFRSGERADHIDPLSSQPVWEVMLQIPTYTALTGGISRGLARRAFADLLPAEIRRRQLKGTGSVFYQQVVRRNREYLRENLLDGRLVADGYLDRSKLESCLAAPDPSLTMPAATILSYLAAEIWLQQWTSAGLPASRAARASAGTAPLWQDHRPQRSAART